MFKVFNQSYHVILRNKEAKKCKSESHPNWIFQTIKMCFLKCFNLKFTFKSAVTRLWRNPRWFFVEEKRSVKVQRNFQNGIFTLCMKPMARKRRQVSLSDEVKTSWQNLSFSQNNIKKAKADRFCHGKSRK